MQKETGGRLLMNSALFVGLLAGMLALGAFGVPEAQAQHHGGHERGDVGRYRGRDAAGAPSDGGRFDPATLRQDLDQRPAPRRERLSPEELRQIRRDIDDAGRDIYRRERHGRAD